MRRQGRQWISLLLAAALALWLPGCQKAAPAVGAAPMQQKLVALTFDDGPRRSTTTQLLDGLAERGVKATFFLVGSRLTDQEDVIQRMDREGHQIGIHTYDHVLLTGLNQADFDAQVEATRTQLKEILGHNDFLLRPPFGKWDAAVQARAGCPIILWSIDPEDWKDDDVERMVSQALSETKDGGIILFHDIFASSVEGALRTVDALHAQGYYFCTIEELFAARGITLQPGEVYWNAYP